MACSLTGCMERLPLSLDEVRPGYDLFHDEGQSLNEVYNSVSGSVVFARLSVQAAHDRWHAVTEAMSAAAGGAQ